MLLFEGTGVRMGESWSGPKVSVIVPVYNSERYLQQCLDSIIEQTLKEIEVICVNDGSSDHSINILKDYAKRDPRFIIIDQENGGQSKARNAGLNRASGKYIAFVDSDDYISTKMLEKLYQQSEKCGTDITITNLLLFDERTKRTEEFRDIGFYLFLKNKIFTAEEYPEIIRSIGVWDRIFKREFLEKYHIRYAEGLVYEDHLFCIQTILKASCICIVPDFLYYYRKNAGESITDNEAENDKYKLDYLTIHGKIQESLKEINIESISEEYWQYFFENAFMHQKNCTNFAFFKKFFKSVQLMLDEKEYAIAQMFENRELKRYAKQLGKNSFIKSWLYFSCRRHIHKCDGRIYFSFTKKGKKFRLF